jgi:hypothetical protein
MKQIRIYITADDHHILRDLFADGITEAAELMREIPADTMLECTDGARIRAGDVHSIGIVLEREAAA